MPDAKLVALLALVVTVPSAVIAQPLSADDPDPEPSATARGAEPVVLEGAQLPGLSAPVDYVETPRPHTDKPVPPTDEESAYRFMQLWEPEEYGDGVRVPVPGEAGGSATPVDEIVAHRWTGETLERVPVQVDERFQRYLTNYDSGFAAYSQADSELTYAYDWEGTRRTCDTGPRDVIAVFCEEQRTTPDPVEGFDHDDELVVLWTDAGSQAPDNAKAPGEATQEVRLTDPLTGEQRFVYVNHAPDAEPLDVSRVDIERDADADRYVRAGHWGYGGAPDGQAFAGDGVDTPWGEVSHHDQRRPKDSATVTTDTYRFHYSGRWKIDGLSFAQGEGYGPSLLDRWKGRAFQQNDGNAADVGGYETENHWTRSSVTLGVLEGPLRVVRETWGADSGTHVTRIDAFYPDRIDQTYHLRVHPMPADGIYAFWDHNEGTVDTYYTPQRAEGVPIDGENDEVYGTNSRWQPDLLGEMYFNVDVPDPTLQVPLANVAADQVVGDSGSIVTTIWAPRTQSGLMTSYYRDDLSFDDGTGHDPSTANQGSFGAHGIHFPTASDTDNAFVPVPTTEFVAHVTQHLAAERLPNVVNPTLVQDRAPVQAAVKGR
jgi:hypothetical protein